MRIVFERVNRWRANLSNLIALSKEERSMVAEIIYHLTDTDDMTFFFGLASGELLVTMNELKNLPISGDDVVKDLLEIVMAVRYCKDNKLTLLNSFELPTCIDKLDALVNLSMKDTPASLPSYQLDALRQLSIRRGTFYHAYNYFSNPPPYASPGHPAMMGLLNIAIHHNLEEPLVKSNYGLFRDEELNCLGLTIGLGSVHLTPDLFFYLDETVPTVKLHMFNKYNLSQLLFRNRANVETKSMILLGQFYKATFMDREFWEFQNNKCNFYHVDTYLSIVASAYGFVYIGTSSLLNSINVCEGNAVLNPLATICHFVEGANYVDVAVIGEEEGKPIFYDNIVSNTYSLNNVEVDEKTFSSLLWFIRCKLNIVVSIKGYSSDGVNVEGGLPPSRVPNTITYYTHNEDTYIAEPLYKVFVD